MCTLPVPRCRISATYVEITKGNTFAWVLGPALGLWNSEEDRRKNHLFGGDASCSLLCVDDVRLWPMDNDMPRAFIFICIPELTDAP